MIKFDMHMDSLTISIDMIFAAIAIQTIPPDFDVCDNKYLTGLDEAGVRSLNGVRVAEMYCSIYAIRYPPFCISVLS